MLDIGTYEDFQQRIEEMGGDRRVPLENSKSCYAPALGGCEMSPLQVYCHRAMQDILGDLYSSTFTVI